MTARDYFEIIDGQFPVRKGRAQKDAFLKYAQAIVHKMGYACRVEENKGALTHRNLVVGEPVRARVVFTAHYDTPAMSLWPDLQTPRNPLFNLFYQMLITALLLAVSFGVMLATHLLLGNARLSLWMLPLTFVSLLALIQYGPANKHNRNDNTSGLAALLALMGQLPAEKREQVAFILTDHSSQGALGARAYAKAHPQAQYTPLVIDLNCLGTGEIMGFATRLARSHPAFETLREALDGKVFNSNRGFAYAADHSAFKCSVGLIACKKVPVLGWCVDRIHTRRDTVADPAVMQKAADRLTSFIHQL